MSKSVDESSTSWKVGTLIFDWTGYFFGIANIGFIWPRNMHRLVEYPDRIEGFGRHSEFKGHGRGIDLGGYGMEETNCYFSGH